MISNKNIEHKIKSAKGLERDECSFIRFHLLSTLRWAKLKQNESGLSKYTEVPDVAGFRVTQIPRYADSLVLFKSLGAWTRTVISYRYAGSVLRYNKNT